jgi:hypothetical protein
MSAGSLKTGLALLAAAWTATLAMPRPAQAAETPPTVVRGAPVIPWAKEVGEHRYRSPRNFEETRAYYDKIRYQHNWPFTREKIVNMSGVRAFYLRNKTPGQTWEGVNVYEHKGATFVFVVYSDAELEKITKEREARKEADKTRSAPGKTR